LPISHSRLRHFLCRLRTDRRACRPSVCGIGLLAQTKATGTTRCLDAEENMLGMFPYAKAAVERAMKVQEVMLRAWAKKITWWQAAEILGISDRHLRRIRERYEQFGYFGLVDGRRGQPSPKRVPVARVEKVLALYREKYFDLNVRHFHEKLREQYELDVSYTWVKSALQ